MTKIIATVLTTLAAFAGTIPAADADAMYTQSSGGGVTTKN